MVAGVTLTIRGPPVPVPGAVPGVELGAVPDGVPGAEAVPPLLPLAAPPDTGVPDDGVVEAGTVEGGGADGDTPLRAKSQVQAAVPVAPPGGFSGPRSPSNDTVLEPVARVLVVPVAIAGNAHC
jgi:hypothetical protein